MRYRNVLFFFKVFLFFSCLPAEKDIAEIHLVDDLRLAQLPDSSYLIRVSSIFIDQGKIYLADPELNNVVVLDENGVFVQNIGQLGRGPGELLWPGQLYSKNDTLFVFSGGKNAIDIFSNSQFVRTIPFSDVNGMYSGGRFFVDSGKVFISMVDLNGSISVIPVNNINQNLSFGQFIRFSTDKQSIIQNHRSVFLHGNTVISVSFFQPIIERYSKDGNLLEMFSYENLELISHRIQNARAQLATENVALCIAADAYIYNDILYVLLCHSDDEGVYSSTILLFDLSGEKIEVRKKIDLGQGWFTAIGVTEENIWAFRSDAQDRYLARFPLKGHKF